MSKEMKCLILVIVIFFTLALLSGCSSLYNRQLVDLTYSYEYALLLLPDGDLIEGHVDSWRDFEDGDQIQVKIDGVSYLTHISNVVLISK